METGRICPAVGIQACLQQYWGMADKGMCRMNLNYRGKLGVPFVIKMLL
jgi:hypothetical protein